MLEHDGLRVDIKWHVATINKRRFVLPESWSWDFIEGFAFTASANDGDELVNETGEIRDGNPDFVPWGVIMAVREINTYYNTLRGKPTS